MDIEKLIEQLNDFNENHIAVLCGSGQCACGYLCDKDDCIVVRAATALSTLQAENENLRSEAEGMRSNWYKSVEEIQKLRAELEQVVQKYETAVKLQVKMTEISNRQMAELEQVKAERDAAVKTIFQWTGCPECKWWDSAGEWCEKHDREADGCGGCESPEWRGQKED